GGARAPGAGGEGARGTGTPGAREEAREGPVLAELWQLELRLEELEELGHEELRFEGVAELGREELQRQGLRREELRRKELGREELGREELLVRALRPGDPLLERRRLHRQALRHARRQDLPQVPLTRGEFFEVLFHPAGTEPRRRR